MTTTVATKTITITAKAPSSAGTFTGIIDANPPEGDSENERFADFVNLPGEFPLVYQHTYSDPGAEIGTVSVMIQEDNRHLTVLGKLDLTNAIARAVYERMLLPSSSALSLKEMSVGFEVFRDATTIDPNGVHALHGVRMLEVSIVYAGAQDTAITSVKNRGERMWAGTRVPQRAVEDLRDKMSGLVEGFLDDIYATEAKNMTPQTEIEEYERQLDEIAGAGTPEHDSLSRVRQVDRGGHGRRILDWRNGIAELSREIESVVPTSDADLIRQVEEMGLDGTKAAAPRGVDPGPFAPVLLQAAARFEQSAVRALGAGLPDEAALLMGAARDLRAVVAGSGGDVQEIIDSLTPIVQALRTAGSPVAGDGLERDLAELAGGAVDQVTNEDRIGGSVDTNPKGGHFVQVGRVSTWTNAEGAA
jgi:HK97 family phage prohead protease